MNTGELLESSTERVSEIKVDTSTKIGYIYPHLPLELFLAHGLHPCLIKADPNVRAGFEDSLQTFSCSFTRNIFSQRTNGMLTSFQGIVFPGNTCDSLQNVGDVWRYRFPDDKVFRLTYPVSVHSESAVAFLAEELRLLSKRLAEVYGHPFSKELYREAVALMNKFKKSAQFLYSARIVESSVLSYSSLIENVFTFLLHPTLPNLTEILNRVDTVRAALSADGILQRAEELRESLVARDLSKIPAMEASYGPRVVFYGGMIDPVAFASLVSNLEGVSDSYIVTDIFTFGFKTVFTPPTGINGDPFEAMAAATLNSPLEPTHEGLRERKQFIQQILKQLKVSGLIICEQSFCDPDEFEAPSIEKAAKEVGVPALRIPFDPELSDRNRVENRLQTFFETLQEGGNR